MVMSCSRSMPDNVQEASFAPVFVGAMAKDTTVPTIDSITISGKRYKIETGSRGGKYVMRVSKTGTTYKYYIPK